MRLRIFALLLLMVPVWAVAQKKKTGTVLYPVMKDDKMGFINNTGQLVVPLQYDAVETSNLPSFSEGLIAFSQNRKWGYLNEKGEVVVAPKYDKAYAFKDGYATVEMKEPGSTFSLSNKAGAIDKTGKEVIPPNYERPFITSTGLNDGMMAVRLPDSYGKNREGYVGVDGVEYFGKTYYLAGDYRLGLAPVKEDKDGLVGFINKKGEYVIKPQFAYAYPFNEDGIAQVSFADKTWGMIDKNGKIIVSGLTYERVSFFGGGTFTEGLMPVKDGSGKYGFMDEKGKIAIPFQYDYAKSSFVNGMTVVNNGCTKTKDNWGFESISGGTWMVIDKKGKIVKTISSNYDEIYGLSEGMAIIKKDKKYGFLNLNGKEIAAPTWEDMPGYFKDGIARFTTPGKYSFSAVKPFGYMTKTGEIIWNPSM